MALASSSRGPLRPCAHCSAAADLLRAPRGHSGATRGPRLRSRHVRGIDPGAGVREFRASAALDPGRGLVFGAPTQGRPHSGVGGIRPGACCEAGSVRSLPASVRCGFGVSEARGPGVGDVRGLPGASGPRLPRGPSPVRAAPSGRPSRVGPFQARAPWASPVASIRAFPHFHIVTLTRAHPGPHRDRGPGAGMVSSGSIGAPGPALCLLSRLRRLVGRGARLPETRDSSAPSSPFIREPQARRVPLSHR